MAKVSAMTKLPDAVRRDFEQRLNANGFGGYSELTEWLKAQGYEISRSSVSRAAKAIKERLAAIKSATDAAKMIVAEAEDTEDSRSAAVMAILQTELFNVLLLLQKVNAAEPEDRVKLLSQASRAVSDLSRASISQKKHATNVRSKAADTAADSARKAGVSPETVELIRRDVLGMDS